MRTDTKFAFTLSVCSLALLAAAWIVSSTMEARAFERLTGNHVTTWDAMWVELRVQAAVERPATTQELMDKMRELTDKAHEDFERRLAK